ncbi:hypothetical protein [Azotobacter beijerinckii]|uniref:Uncharacterized protein n=1 Tax=Azotobacter beijerinckii TaxID=170623 RepID=A0A1I0Z0Y4_9GAMM|nr:hypothetical protein [Azotobacter beijerinckii]SFB19274.1 hypothetical protein SAMN04244571_01729 [Azotobacter beijerinckii]
MAAATEDDTFEPEHEHLLDDDGIPEDDFDDLEDDEEGPDPILDEDEEDDYERDNREGWEGNIERWNDL